MCWKAVVLVCSYFAFFAVLADKNLMMVNDARSNWISAENLTLIIEVSLNWSTCTNVHLLGHSHQIESLFENFLRAYRHEYMLNESTFSCSGYFILSTSIQSLTEAIKRVPTSISNTEILIIIDGAVEASAALFEVAPYENAKVNIVAANGLWSLSENFLSPRKFTKVSRYDEMKHRRGIVNLEGRELQVATDANRPLSFLETTGHRTINGIEREVFIAGKGEKESELDGIEVKLFLLMAELLNFTWTMWTPNSLYRYGDRSNNTGWHGGIIGLLADKEIDMAFSGIWLDLPQYAIVNLTTPWTQVEVRFLVPRPKPYTSFWALTRPLSPEVWMAVFAMLTIQTIYVYIRAWITPQTPKRFRSFVITCSELIARLLGLSVNANWQGFKLQFLLWQMVGILLVTAYSSSLAASLASSTYEDRIDTTKQFIEANLTWGREGTAPEFSSFQSDVDPWAKRFLSRFQSEVDENERHRKILKGNYAILGRVIGSTFYPENYIRDTDVEGYRLMKNHVGQFYTSFGVQPWLLEACNEVLLRLREGGLVHYHLRDVLHRQTAAAYHEVLVEYDDLAHGPRILKFIPLGAAFALLAVGLISASVSLFFELQSVH